MEIYGNPISAGAERKARRQQRTFMRKFGFDSAARYQFTAVPNPILGPAMGVQNLAMTAAGKEIDARKSLIVATLLFVNVGPRFLPYQALIVRSGSMSPAIPTGSVVVYSKAQASQLHVGQIIRPGDDDHGHLRKLRTKLL